MFDWQSAQRTIESGPSFYTMVPCLEDMNLLTRAIVLK